MSLKDSRERLAVKLELFKKQYGVPNSELEDLMTIFQQYAEDIFSESIDKVMKSREKLHEVAA
jgi:hypothetical protein